MPFQPTPITGVAMFSCIQLMSGCGMTFGSNPFPFGALEDEEPNLATTRAGGQQRETADQEQPPDEHRPS